MVKLSEKLNKISSSIENEKVSRYDQYENKIMNLYSSIEETKDSNNKKFNDVKEQVLIIQKTLDDEGQKREATHNEFMEFLKKMEEKIFDKFNTELQNKKDLESNVSTKLEEKFNTVKVELQKESKTRYDHIENLEYYFERELPKIQEGFKQEQAEREENDNNNVTKLTEEFQKINSLITAEKKNREETQEGILEMIKIMNERMKNDLDLEKKEREQNEEVLIELLESTCARLQQSTK
eukprot:CAMPEP_0170514788 /NCGR_PEP_ID=MMETSP0209-20121228/1340_1 /TAXON_ID=665100 ORGANISM="Litonotus pictus, Strain P1" /NCGR_SAMPLE_ID=MMETSP0209 /ASSEMBLY_ACC=CAM_ASM_000301 /LENGTH=237 /DNA_ID=CAMNT_0010799013 /DNA_START=83 /DNA_END=796 /DNA_ORIENTATION=-